MRRMKQSSPDMHVGEDHGRDCSTYFFPAPISPQEEKCCTRFPVQWVCDDAAGDGIVFTETELTMCAISSRNNPEVTIISSVAWDALLPLHRVMVDEQRSSCVVLTSLKKKRLKTSLPTYRYSIQHVCARGMSARCC